MIKVCRMFGAVPHARRFLVSAHCRVRKVLSIWCHQEGIEIAELMFTCNGRIFHHSLCAAEMMDILNSSSGRLQIHVHLTGFVVVSYMMAIAQDADIEHYEPLVHP